MCLPAKTLITGLAPSVSTAGKILDPLNLTGAFGPKKAAVEQPAPANERDVAEAQAAQRANAELADANRRRRGQQSLLAKGAPAAVVTPPQFSFGDSTLAPDVSPLSPGAARTSRSTTARAASLMSRGGPAFSPGPTVTYGGGGRANDIRMAAL